MQIIIKALIMDVDGTLTDGKVYMSAKGEIVKAFNIKDGYGIVHAQKLGLIPIIITGRSSEIVSRRCKELGIKYIYQGIENKLDKLKEIIKFLNITFDEVAYIGDDLNDIECIQICGLTASPSDACIVVKESVDYVCQCKGGNGAVREFIDYLLKNNYLISF